MLVDNFRRRGLLVLMLRRRRIWTTSEGGERKVGRLWISELRSKDITQDLLCCTSYQKSIRKGDWGDHVPVIIKSPSALLSISASNNLSSLACVNDDLR